MKLRWKIATVIVLLPVIVFFLLPRLDNRAQKMAERTRVDLHKQGFKTDLAEFNFSTPDELREREAALTVRGYTVRPTFLPGELDLMTAVGSDTALVLWKEEKLQTYSGEYFWAELRESLKKDKASLDSACAAALTGPIRFDLDASGGSGILLPHLAALKNLAQTLSSRTVLELHDDNKNAAWNDLLASTRLVTAWQPEPVDISQFVRFSCATIAYNTTWQMLQEKSWADDQLAGLQREWESVDFLYGLPETAAFSRASAVAMCRLERHQRVSSGVTFEGIFHSPLSTWSQLRYYWRQRSYPNHGSYEDERALLLYYRDREIQLSRAVQSPNWSAMRELPGVTNPVPFQSKYSSGMQSLLNMKQITLQFAGQGGGLLGRAAEAETRRRILLAAVALERRHKQYGSYPKTLQEVAPEYLKNPPTDFMDGSPLRYRLAPDGNFVLYSVGLDCIDNNGQMQPRLGSSQNPRQPISFEIPQGGDLVWPRPAGGNEVATQRAQAKEAKEKNLQEILQKESEREKEE